MHVICTDLCILSPINRVIYKWAVNWNGQKNDMMRRIKHMEINVRV